MTLHLNKKHVLFQVERSQEGLKTIFVVTAKEKEAKLSPNRHFWNVLNVVLQSLCCPFGEIAQCFSEGLDEKYQNNCTQSKTTKTTFPKKWKAVFFLSIRYCKTSQTQDVESQGTKRSVRKLAHSKLDSAFEQKTGIVSSGEIWGSSQNSFFSYNQSNQPTRAQNDNFWTYSRPFRKFSVFLTKKELFL